MSPQEHRIEEIHFAKLHTGICHSKVVSLVSNISFIVRILGGCNWAFCYLPVAVLVNHAIITLFPFSKCLWFWLFAVNEDNVFKHNESELIHLTILPVVLHKCFITQQWFSYICYTVYEMWEMCAAIENALVLLLTYYINKQFCIICSCICSQIPGL